MLITADRTTIHFETLDGRSRHLAMHRITSVVQDPPPKRTKSKSDGRRQGPDHRHAGANSYFAEAR